MRQVDWRQRLIRYWCLMQPSTVLMIRQASPRTCQHSATSDCQQTRLTALEHISNADRLEWMVETAIARKSWVSSAYSWWPCQSHTHTRQRSVAQELSLVIHRKCSVLLQICVVQILQIVAGLWCRTSTISTPSQWHRIIKWSWKIPIPYRRADK